VRTQWSRRHIFGSETACIVIVLFTIKPPRGPASASRTWTTPAVLSKARSESLREVRTNRGELLTENGLLGRSRRLSDTANCCV